MVNSLKIGQTVWTVQDPRVGIVKLPIKDTVREVENKHNLAAILEKTNYLNKEPVHWTNDYYGNLIPAEHLFTNLRDALLYLEQHYSYKYDRAFAHATELQEYLKDIKNKLEDML